MDVTNQKRSRRSMIKSLFATVMATGAGMFGITHAKPRDADLVKRVGNAEQPSGNDPLFSGAVVHNGLVYVAGKGEHSPGDITDHTIAALNKVEEELVNVGSSMEKVLKVTVFLNDIRDYGAMNDAYRGRFGDNPPVRSTVACPSGLPGSTLVEIDCIAAL